MPIWKKTKLTLYIDNKVVLKVNKMQTCYNSTLYIKYQYYDIFELVG